MGSSIDLSVKEPNGSVKGVNPWITYTDDFFIDEALSGTNHAI